MSNPVEFLESAIGGSLTIDDVSLGSAADDHFRIRLSRLLTDGSTVAVFLSDPFAEVDLPFVLSLQDEDDSALPDAAGVREGSYYQLEVVAYDSGEMASEVVDESFVWVRPSFIAIVAPIINSDGNLVADVLDEDILTKLLTILGRNRWDSEILMPDGYPVSVTKRGYASLSAAEAAALLNSYNNPSDVGAESKFRTTISVGADGISNAADTVEVAL